MNDQQERRRYLIDALLREQPRYRDMALPVDIREQKQLLRALMNIRMPAPVSEEFRQIQDEYLSEETRLKGITDIRDLEPVQEGLYLWQGDITTLRCGAIVNAANSQMLGCFCPNHGCIDNAIHTYSGVQLREACADIMRQQGYEEPTGRAKLTPAFNLPCGYIIHTVGPIVRGMLTQRDRELLESCYRSCMTAACENDIDSIAFCCISTGEFHFPNDIAARIAVDTVRAFREETGAQTEVIFNVFKDYDYELYRELLAKH